MPDLPTPELTTQLDALRAVAAHGTMTGAGRALCLPGAAVAQRVADLADALDTNLLDVDAGRLVPTPCGIWCLTDACPRLDGGPSTTATSTGRDMDAAEGNAVDAVVPPCASETDLPCVGPSTPFAPLGASRTPAR